MSDEIPTITEDEYAEHAEAEDAEKQAFVKAQVNKPSARVLNLFTENDSVQTMEAAAEIAYYRSKLCTDEGGDNL